MESNPKALIMDISDIYMSVGQKRNISHFANIVRIAKSDGIITQEEIAFLQNVANKYNIENDKFQEIFKNPDKFPTIGHLNCLERIERLYDLVIMIKADDVVAVEEVSALRKIATGLAFPIKDIDKIVDTAIKIDIENSNLENFQKEMLESLKL